MTDVSEIAKSDRMTVPAINIRSPEDRDGPQWRALWLAYLRFCGSDLADDITDLTWHRILDPDSAISARVADVNGELAGFAVLVLHAGTWTRTPICYLEDLYVGEAVRGHGVGRALLDDLMTQAKDNGWSRLYWHTKTDNAVARQLYDSFVKADALVRYRLIFEKE